MKAPAVNTGLVLILALLLVFPLVTIDSNGTLAPTRGPEEDIHMDIDIEFVGMTGFDIDVTVNIYKMTFGDTTYNSTVLRGMFHLQPSNTEEMIDAEVEGRVHNLTSMTFSEDTIVITSSELDDDTMDLNLTDDDPVVYYVYLSGSTDIGRYIDTGILGRLEEGREDIFIAGLLMSGFDFTRTTRLRADPGQVVAYHFPASWDPFGDNEVSILLREVGVEPVENQYLKVLDSSEGQFIEEFTFSLTATPRTIFHEEVITGDILLDWYELDMVEVSGEIMVGPIGSERSEALDDLPPSMRSPDAIPPGFLRFAHGEGVLDDDDISNIEEQVSSEMEESLSGSLDGDEIIITAEMDLGIYTAPTNGRELAEIIGDPGTNDVNVDTGAPIELDILEGYDRDDVIGLLNGGLRIRKEVDQITDDRLTVNITLPDNMIFVGEPYNEINGVRRSYTYSSGYKLIGSTLAPEFSEEKVVLNATFDLSSVDSLYVADMVIDIDLEAVISIHRIEFDPNEYEVNTNLDYELDYLTSDLIRLLDRMGIVNRSEIEDKVEDEVMDLIEDMMDEEGREVSVTLSTASMEFDNEVTHVDDEFPIEVKISATGTMEPIGGTGGSEENYGRTNRFIPPHVTIVPVRTIIKTIDISGLRYWDVDLEVIFPSGSIIKAWLGEGSNDKVTELEVITRNGYPTLMLKPEDGAGDHITLEFAVGPYFAFNNVMACFCSATGMVLLMFLFVILFIVKGIVRRNKERPTSEEGEDTGEEVTDTPPETTTIDKDGNEVLNW